MDQTVRAPATDVASGAHRARAVEEGNCNNSTDDDKAQHDLHDESATSLASPCRSQLPQLPQPHDGASEAPISDSSASFSSASTEPARALQLRRSSSLHRAVFASSSGGSDSDRPGRRWRSDEQDSHNEDDRASSELVLQLQRLCRRQRQRAEERAFVRDVERVMALLRAPLPTSRDVQVTSATFPGYGLSLDLLSSGHESDTVAAVAVDEGQSSGTSDSSRFSTGRVRRSHDRRFASRVTLTLAEIDALLDCIADLFEHRNPDVRALAFEVVHLCVLRFGERLTPALRRKIYLQLESHPSKDFLLRQKVLRTLTHDGRHVEPFHVELGWFLLRLLEQSDAQKDLLGLIQSILRRSPRALDRDKVIAIVSVISGRCDIAWSRSDLDACHRSIAFFHVLATHDLAYAASTPACLRSLCCLVNADGHGTWSVMKLLLTGCSGFLVLRGLVQMLEHPTGVNSPWVLRGAVFFVGMSCWGSQRVAKFDDIAWGPILLALERALQCGRRVVVFEVILSIQRLIKKFGTAHLPAASGGQSTARSTNMSTKASPHCGDSREETSKVGSGFGPPNPGADSDKRCLIVEWDIILRMLHTLRPWASVTDESETEEFPERISQPNDRRMGGDVNQPAPVHPTNDLPDQPHPQLLVSIQQTRVPRELLDTLLAVEDLVERRRFAGDVKEFLNILEQYLPRLSEDSMLFLLRQRADATHPGYHLTWLTTLSSVMRTFFSGVSSDGDDLLIPRAVRLEALEILRVNLWTSRYVCEDRVIEEVVIPTLGQAYNDPDAEVRRRALGFIIEAARQLESAKFDSLLDILANAMIHSGDNDAQLLAASGVVSLFSSAFDHLPPARAVRMYDLLVTTVEVHRSRAVRRIALSCLLCVCEARAIDGRLQWKEQQQVRTSRFLFISRRSARVNSSNIQSTAARVPVARAFRALLSLVTAEPDAELFRIAVQGIKTMLENRTILEDVDVSEVSAKIVASIDYGAFGRAAIADEVDRMLGDHIGQQKLASVDASVCRDEKDREEHVAIDRLISQTNVELVHSIYVKRRRDDPDKSAKTFCTSLRATIVLLARTRYLGMGIELLQLLVSYDSELHYHTLQELTRCLVGCIESRLAVADKDFLMGGAAAEDSTSSLSASVSAPDMLYRHDGAEPEPRIAGTFVSDTPLGFTSRVLSRFQTSASHGSLFHAFSGSMGKSALEHKPGSKSPSEKAVVSSYDEVRRRSRNERVVDSVGNAVSSNDCGAQAWCSPQESVSQQSADMTALPPLPAHDDIIESPSYCCENTQVRCHTQRKRDSLDCRSKSKQYRQAEGDDGEEGSSCRSVTRSKQEDAEESADVERRQELANNKRWETETDTVSHNDRLSDGLRLRVVTPSTLQSGEANPSTTGSVCGRDEYDPTCLMTQLFDLSVRNRPQLLRDGPALKLALNVLDRTPELETHKIGLLYVRDGKKPSESTILGTAGGSLRYLRFLRRLGTFTKLEGFPGYTGGLDTMNNSDGKFGLVYQDACAQIMFHVATMMVPQSYRRDSNPAAENFASMQKKRHIGNDFVHVVFKECDEDYDLRTISGQFNDVHIVIQPLNDHEYRTQVHVKQGIAPFGPLYGRQVVSSSIISECVRLTCMNANLACQVFHQDLIGFALNCEERLKQIKQLGLRLATSGDWNLDE
ncbi:unnamed protein product [Hyaloperonospora brassicae]|uniref:Rap-GAP domain-containing protein n=1 Tax=Hyaloperonospora brassicae TaxID=162125 RepID=A0AAV0USK1_HYABA|nr:unnamed protein product [Hyaloperonospora brassicae]